MSDNRRYKPLRSQQTRGPSALAGLDGSRRPGSKVQLSATKAPKRRFDVGQIFQYDGAYWKIIYMYRLRGTPGWMHCLEEIRGFMSRDAEMLSRVITVIGAGATTPRVVYEEFHNTTDVYAYFIDIYRNGDSVTFDTQQMLAKAKFVGVER